MKTVYSGLRLTIIIGLLYLLSLWTDRNLNYFVSLIKGESVDVPFWLSVVVTILLNAVIVVSNIIAEISRLAL